MLYSKHEESYGEADFTPIPSHYIDERLVVLDKRIDEVLEDNWIERDCKLLNKLLRAKQFWLNFKELYCEEEDK